jgi:UDP-glucose 4-epimerase
MRVKDARQTFLGIWLRLVCEDKPFEVWGGRQLRDFSYVDDTVDAMLLAALTPGCDGHAFNIGGDRTISLQDLAELVVQANGAGTYVAREFPAERKRIDIGDYHADDGYFRTTAGWAPRVPLEDGLRQSIAYYRQHLSRYL